MAEDGSNAERDVPARRWPGLRLLAAVRMAFDARKLIIAAVGVLLLQLGWSLLDMAFPGSIDVTPDVLSRGDDTRPTDGLAWPSGSTLDRLAEPARVLIGPLSSLLEPANRGPAMLHALLGLAWLIVVWGYCGGAIARIAAIQEARSRQSGIAEAVRFALRSGPALLLVPFYPLLAMAFCTLPGLAFGVVYRIPTGPAVAGVFLFIPLLAGLFMTLLAAALVAGWPMFHAALAAGADDSLDAMSRTYSYLNQRLVLFAAGVAIAAVAGLLGIALVDGLAAGVFRLTLWSLSIDGPPSRIAALFGGEAGSEAPIASTAHGFWLGAVRLFAGAWVYSYFWTAATLLYLWLRHEVDGVPSTVIDPPGATTRA